tara:strand:- start:420 stop:905 length:486 start_codon:yes stop_codon:yes gene_type:complete
MDYKYNTKQRYKSIQGLRSFHDTLPLKVKKIIHKKGHIFSETLENWKFIVGEKFFPVCFPKSFKNSNKLKESCLNILVKRGYEVELEYSKNIIIKKMNSFFGHKVVEKIKLISFEDNAKKINKRKNNKDVTINNYAKKIRHIKNEKLKESLMELSKLIKKK